MQTYALGAIEVADSVVAPRPAVARGPSLGEGHGRAVRHRDRLRHGVRASPAGGRRDGPRARLIGVPVPARRHRRLPAGAGRRRPPRTGLGAPGPDGLRADAPARGTGRPCRHGRGPGGGDRHRDRLHLVHDAADDSQRHPARRDPGAAARSPRVGQALEAPRRPARGGPDQRRRPQPRRAVAAALRRQDLLGVVLQQEPPDPRRIARDLSRRRPPHRGDGLGGLAADRRRDPQQLHRRLQGDLVEGGRVPAATTTSGRSRRGLPASWTTRCRARSCRSATAPAR